MAEINSATSSLGIQNRVRRNSPYLAGYNMNTSASSKREKCVPNNGRQESSQRKDVAKLVARNLQMATDSNLIQFLKVKT